MKTLFKIAWRNCWRNKLRSAIVSAAIVIGIWGSIFMIGLLNAFMNQRADKLIQVEVGEIQVHAKNFDTDMDIVSYIEDPAKLNDILSENSSIEAYANRFVVEASAMSAHGQQGVQLIGVNPEEEIRVLGLYKRLVDGSYFDTNLRYPILVGKKMAEDLKLKLKSKVQLSFVSPQGEQIGKTFKVVGIFQAGDDLFDSYTVFIPKSKVKDLIGEDLTHEVVIKLQKETDAKLVAQQIEEKDQGVNQVESYLDRYPEVAYALEFSEDFSYYMMIVVMLALLFGIINTLIMSILERKQELGILMAIGMTKTRVRIMILFESLIYSFVGVPLGLVVSWLTINRLSTQGLDLSGFGQGLQAFGFDPVLIFEVDTSSYFTFALAIVLSTLIGAIYPSFLATKANPIESIRDI